MPEFKIATFNANSIRAREPIILQWLASEKPDVLCIQETKVQDQDFPVAAYSEAGYHSSFYGQKSYNGVATLSRSEPGAVNAGFGDGEENPEQARLLHTRINGIDIVNTYIPQGFEPGSDKFAYKLRWFERLGNYFDKNFSQETRLIWTGDINVAPEPEDVHNPVKLKGSCGFHPDEQAALYKLAAWGFTDIFRKHVPGPGQFTFYDYRVPKSVERGLGWRIDHIFATAPVAERSVNSYIDLEPRNKEKPSDHTFLVAVFNIE